jgi:hypothetical protein
MTDDSLSIFFVSGFFGRKIFGYGISNMADFRSTALDEVFVEVKRCSRLFLFNPGSEAQVSYSWTDFIDDCVKILKVNYTAFAVQILEYFREAIQIRRTEIDKLESELDPDIVSKIRRDLDTADRVLNSSVIGERELSRIVRTSISPGFIKREWRIHNEKQDVKREEGDT